MESSSDGTTTEIKISLQETQSAQYDASEATSPESTSDDIFTDSGRKLRRLIASNGTNSANLTSNALKMRLNCSETGFSNQIIRVSIPLD